MRKLYVTGIRSRMVALCVVGLAVGATACGGGGSSTSAGSGFVAQANSLCHSVRALYGERAAAYGQASQEYVAHPDELKRVTDATAAVARKELAEIDVDLGKMEALTPPRELQPPYELLVASMQGVAATQYAVDISGEEEDAGLAESAMGNETQEIESINAFAKAAGLKECVLIDRSAGTARSREG